MSVTTGPTISSKTSGIDWGGLEIETPSYSVRRGLDSLGELLGIIGATRPMLVLSRDAVVASGLRSDLQSALSSCATVCFDEFTPNPTSEECVRAAYAAAAHGADAVIGIGGGTAMDIAKIAALGASEPSRLDAVLRDDAPFPERVAPIVAVPTTSGTGAEATHFAAVYIDGMKRSIASASLRPRGAVLDARFHRVMPAKLAAVTGLDALCQALESIWAAGATDLSRGYAHQAADLASGSIVASVRDGNPTARERMLIGSHLSGHAINISKTTLAHALSYMLTQRFGIPHGHAVALLIGATAQMNAAHGAVDLVDDAVAHLGCDAEGVLQKMRTLLMRLELAPTLADAGVPRGDLDRIARSVDPVRMSNNPVALDHGALVELLSRAWRE